MPSKGSTSARGYGGKHQAERASWTPKVRAGGVNCRRCGNPIDPREPWDLGHQDHDRSLPRHPEHRKCNRAAPSRRRSRPAAPPVVVAPALKFFDTTEA